MDLERDLQLRRQFEFKVKFTDAEWSEISKYWRTIQFKKGTAITTEGQIEKRFYFAYQGVQSLFFRTESGHEKILGFTFPYSFSGVYDSFISQSPAFTNLTAITDSELLFIGYDDMMLLYEKFKSFERWGRLFIEEILVGRGKREIELSSLSALERFEVFMKRCPPALKTIPQKYLASYLEMTPETFSRLRRETIS
ncbi:MAG: Crp/Fnr family transcriptional regulator [Flavobacteriales bacterium]|nr:Crp/Fnr family transcriptional regulator [Flavobacteriales bacterium]